MLKELRTIQPSPIASEIQDLLDTAQTATENKRKAIFDERCAKDQLLYKLVEKGWLDCLTVSTTGVRRRIYWETHK